MPATRNSEIIKHEAIPTEWSIKRLKYCATEISKGAGITKEEVIEDGNTQCVRYGEIYSKYNNSFSDCYSATNKEKLTSLRFFAYGDILFAGTGELIEEIGKNIVYLGDKQCLAGGDIIVVKHEQNPSFLNYALNSVYSQAQKSCGKLKLKVVHISPTEIGNIDIALPNLSEQERIATFLDSKCAEIDALTADIQAQIDTLEEYKRSVITEAVTKGLNKDAEMQDSGIEWANQIPKHWEILKGKYNFKQRNDRGNSKSLQLLSPTQNFGVIPQSKYEELTGMSAVKLKEDVDLSALKTIHSGDFCISLRSFQGGFEYSTYEGVVSPAYQVFYAAYRQIDDRYFKYMFKEKGFIEKMNSYTLSLRDGKNIAFADFGNSYLPIPPSDEQKRIADYIDRKVADINAIIDIKHEQLATLDAYKKSLIYEYVTGKKSVSEVS